MKKTSWILLLWTLHLFCFGMYFLFGISCQMRNAFTNFPIPSFGSLYIPVLDHVVCCFACKPFYLHLLCILGSLLEANRSLMIKGFAKQGSQSCNHGSWVLNQSCCNEGIIIYLPRNKKKQKLHCVSSSCNMDHHCHISTSSCIFMIMHHLV